MSPVRNWHPFDLKSLFLFLVGEVEVVVGEDLLYNAPPLRHRPLKYVLNLKN